jgi:hypothetical protein
MFLILVFSLLAAVVSSPSFAQSQSKSATPTGKMTYAKCLELKQKAGLPAARAAQVCQSIVKNN